MSDTENRDAISSDEEAQTKTMDEEKTEETTPQKDESKDEKNVEKSPSPKKASPKKRKREEEEEDEEESSDEEEPPLGLLERPVIIESGKREKRKVERLEVSMNVTPKEKKFDIAEGSGEKLGDIPRVEFFLNKTLSDDLKPLHRLLYNRPGSSNEIKRNIRKFSGFSFERGSKDYDKKMLAINKFTVSMLKTVCDVLDLEKTGTKDSVIARVIDFLFSPKSSGKALPKSKKRKSTDTQKKKGAKKQTDTKKKKAEKVEEDDDDDDDLSDDEEEKEEKDDASKDDNEEKDDEASSAEEEEEESDEEPPPPKKKAKTESPKKQAKKTEAPKKKKVPTATLR